MARIVYVTRQLGADAGESSGAFTPAAGDGIGARNVAQPLALAGEHDVTVVTTVYNASVVAHLREFEPRVRWILVDEPAVANAAGFYNDLHDWSSRAFAALCELFEAEGAADYVEFTDFQGTGMVTIQARVTADPRMADTRVGVRLCNNSEMCHVLDGELPDDPELRTMFDMERYCLANADVLTYAPGGDVLGTYDRFYEGRLAPALPVEHVTQFAESESDLPSAATEPLRMLCLGRLERVKGVHNLAAALAGSTLQGWTLTFAGADTETAAMATSMASTIEQSTAFDDRIKLIGRVPYAEVPQLIRDHDVLITASLWECHPNVGIEALANNRPILATPVGGHAAMVEPGVTGYLAAGTDQADIRELVATALANRDALIAMAEDRAPLKRFRELSDPVKFRASLARVLETPARRAEPETGAPRVSVVSPYFKLSDFIEETVDSVLEQDFPVAEVLLVNDGSIAAEDEVLDRLAEHPKVRVLTTFQSGPAAARNLGVRQTIGDYVLFIDSDDKLDPGFVRRAVDAMAANPAAAYICSWMRYITVDGEPISNPEGYYPLGNSANSLDHGVATSGGSTMLVRRSSLERGVRSNEMNTGSEDTELHMHFRHAGMFGHIIPQFLCNYRVRDDSGSRLIRWPNAERLENQTAAALRYNEVRWLDESKDSGPNAVTNTMQAAIDELRSINNGLAKVLERERAGESPATSPTLETAIAEADACAQMVAANDTEIERLAAQLTRLVDEKASITDGIERANQSISDSSRTLAAIHGSRRWALLAPLRYASRILRRG